MVQEPLHSRLSVEGSNVPISAALHPDSPTGGLRKASGVSTSELCVDCHVISLTLASSIKPMLVALPYSSCTTLTPLHLLAAAAICGSTLR